MLFALPRLTIRTAGCETETLDAKRDGGGELPGEELDQPDPEGPKQGQRIMRAGAHRLAHTVQRLVAIPAKPRDGIVNLMPFAAPVRSILWSSAMFEGHQGGESFSPPKEIAEDCFAIG